MEEIKQSNNPCWKGYHPDPKQATKMKGGKQVPNCIPMNEEVDEYDVEDSQDIKEFISYIKEHLMPLQEGPLEEAEYHGRKVPLGKPMRGDVKKFKVYVKNPKGKVVKVNFGQKGMKIKKSIPARRRSFRARHNCASPGPRTKARYWSCRKW